MITIESIKKDGWLIFEAIVGSKAYGLDTEKSDTDIRGVYVVPKELFYSMEWPRQVANELNDIVYYEISRFVELLSKNNPNIMELLNIPDDFVLYKHAVMDFFQSELFLSKLCEKTFANYAYSQVKKAYGLEKKIVNPVDLERKTVIDFCYVYEKGSVRNFTEFLSELRWKQEDCGLTALSHLRDCYNLYHSEVEKFSGVVRKENSNDVALSQVSKRFEPIALLYFNKDAYSGYCKKYAEYWEWVEKRNENRYATTIEHGKKYDSKNMMHVFRLLRMAKEIAVEGKINVRRLDREFLLEVKAGKFEYKVLLEEAEDLKEQLGSLYQNSNLQEEPDLEKINRILVEVRETIYKGN